MTKAEKFRSLFATKATGDYLSNHPPQDESTSYKLLKDSLSDSDIDELIDEKIVFIILVSPASQDILIRDLPKGSKIICFDKNALSSFDPHQITAMLLHEIGHALSPHPKKLDGELNADAYAEKRGFGEAMLSGLRQGLALKLPGFEENDVFMSRIVHLEGLARNT